MCKNVYCVGRNYRLHAQELGNEVPTSPLLFTKPTHAVVTAVGQEIVLPGDQGEIHHEVEWVVRVARHYEAGMACEDVIDAMALGIDFTLRNVQTELKRKGSPWLAAKGFKNSAVLTPFRAFPGLAACEETTFSLYSNGQRVQAGSIRYMLFPLGTLLDFIALHFGLDEGDIIFTGTPAGVAPVHHGDVLQMRWGDDVWGQFTVATAQQ